MAENKVEELLKNRVSWLADSGPEDDIAISSRIRLARNLDGIPFPIVAEPDQLLSVISAVKLATERASALADPLEFDMKSLCDIDRHMLLERRLVSRDFLSDCQRSGLIVSQDETFSIMINEEDHLRLQAMRPGFQLHEVWDVIDALDDKLSSELPYVFDKNLGYLTSCPTNVGTGLRASVMLHLPGLVLSGQINAVIQGVAKLGLAVRGIFGEGTENLGNLYQVSNQSTLGESELQIIDRLEIIIRQIIGHEKNARHTLLEQRQNFLLDHVGRAYGILRHAYTISCEESLKSLSALRLGVDMGMFASLDIHTINELFLIVEPAHLQKFARRELESPERDIFRASLIRERLRSTDRK
ncbi:MAG: protein arginine kinase [Lentisphaerae bacterium GWF2_52_8]|nr:MAG: protein arginine kinase [Lentisphaerae bacterium GWF2_52_8]